MFAGKAPYATMTPTTPQETTFDAENSAARPEDDAAAADQNPAVSGGVSYVESAARHGGGSAGVPPGFPAAISNPSAPIGGSSVELPSGRYGGGALPTRAQEEEGGSFFEKIFNVVNMV